MEEEVGRVLDPPSRWVRSKRDEPDLDGVPVEGLDGSCKTFLYELSDDGVALRAIELMGESGVPVGASSLAEFWEAQGYKAQAATPALVEYEKRYGGVPEGSEQLGRLPACRNRPGRVRARLAHQPPVSGTAPTYSHFREPGPTP